MQSWDRVCLPMAWGCWNSQLSTTCPGPQAHLEWSWNPVLLPQAPRQGCAHLDSLPFLLCFPSHILRLFNSSSRTQARARTRPTGLVQSHCHLPSVCCRYRQPEVPTPWVLVPPTKEDDAKTEGAHACPQAVGTLLQLSGFTVRSVVLGGQGRRVYTSSEPGR